MNIGDCLQKIHNYGKNIIYSLFTFFDRKIHIVHSLFKFRPHHMRSGGKYEHFNTFL